MVYKENLEQTITMFVDEFKDEEVGLVVKTSQAKNSIMDKNKQNKNLICYQSMTKVS